MPVKEGAEEIREEKGLKYWEPLELSPLHKTVIALVATGLKNKEIASIVGLGEARVSIIRNHPDAEGLLAQLTTDHINAVVSDVTQMIQGSAKEAYLKVVDLMRNAKNETVQRDCAMDLLDRAGFTAKINDAPPAVNFGESGAQKIVQALKDSQGAVKIPRQVESAKEVLDNVQEADYEVVEH